MVRSLESLNHIQSKMGGNNFGSSIRALVASPVRANPSKSPLEFRYSALIFKPCSTIDQAPSEFFCGGETTTGHIGVFIVTGIAGYLTSVDWPESVRAQCFSCRH